MSDQETTPTPRPWKMQIGIFRRDHFDTSADVHGAHGQFVADCGCHDAANANAALIVQAVNSHEALVAALKSLSNEGHAILALSQDAIKDTAGYTNLKCFQMRLDEADAALKLATQASEDQP